MINEEYLSSPDSPRPRLKHIEPGQFFTLLKDGKTHRLARKDGMYGYLESGARIGLSAELDRGNMVFGDKKGWRVRGNQ